MSMLQEPLMLAIRYGGEDSVDVGGSIQVDNIASGGESYRFNVVIS